MQYKVILQLTIPARAKFLTLGTIGPFKVIKSNQINFLIRPFSAFNACLPDSILTHFSLTTTAGATATITFEGNAAYVYGGTDTLTGLYSISVDNSPPVTFNGTSDSQTNFQVLMVCHIFPWMIVSDDSSQYYTETLSSGQHSLVITNVQQGSVSLYLICNKFHE